MRVAVIVVLAGAVLSVAVLAGTDDIVAIDVDGEIELGGGRGRVLEDANIGHALGPAYTQVQWSKVANGLRSITPLATLFNRNTLGVNVVLRRSALALPRVVAAVVGAGEWDGAAGLRVKRDALGFSACAKRKQD